MTGVSTSHASSTSIYNLINNTASHKADRVQLVSLKGHEEVPCYLGQDHLSKTSRSSSHQQLKGVMERCSKMAPGEKFLPKVDREGKTLGDTDYSIPSPPERDTSSTSHLTQAHLEHYNKFNETRLSQLSIDGGYDGSQTSLSRSELEQYSRYEDVRPPSHSQQPSYAQSEGYHSYVSSADSTTPFLDRLRRENESLAGRESSASSGSSSETLKWHGSLSDVNSAPQLIAHSARVPMPQRHHSESVLYLEPWPSHNQINNQMRRLFPVSTYEPTSPRFLRRRSPPKLSVAERICEFERNTHKCPSLDEKRNSHVSDHASLKAIQKKALLSFYERHHSAWKSEPQLTTPGIPPQPPPRPQPPPPTPSRRSSSASDFAGAINRDLSRSSIDPPSLDGSGVREAKHQHSNSCGSLSSSVVGPVIIGPAISVDDWVPARPPKKPHLRPSYQAQRVPSPDLPPPSPPPVIDNEVHYSDEPLPPPPPEDILQGQLTPPSPERPTYRSRSTKYDKVMNASSSLDNLMRSDSKLGLLNSISQDHSTYHGVYENGSDLFKRSLSVNDNQKNSYSHLDKFNERYIDNGIESIRSNFCDSLNDQWDKKKLLESRRYTSERKLPDLHKMSVMSPPLPSKSRWPSSNDHQPKSLDSELSMSDYHMEINRPGPQTPIHKKVVTPSANHAVSPMEPGYKGSRESFLRSQGESQAPNQVVDRQTSRFGIATQKLMMNGKLSSTTNGRVSPPSRKANLVRTPSDVVKRISFSTGARHPTPIGKTEVPPKSPPALPPHCPPTTLQLSQSKASYLAYRREPREKERGLPNFQGSYKRTMSPSGGRIVDSTGVCGEQPTGKECEIRGLTKESKSLDVSEGKVEASQTEKKSCDIDVISRTLPRNYSLTVVQPKRTVRPARAQSDPTSSIKIEKTTVSTATQDNLEEPPRKEVKIPVETVVSEKKKEVEGVTDPCGRVTDAASQTTPAPSPPPTAAPPPPRRHLQEEIECDQLSRDLASQLSPSHKLHGILVPGPDVKKTTDYVTGLFRLDFPARSRSSIALPPLSTSPTTNETSEKSTETPVTQNGHCSPPIEPKSRLPIPTNPQTESITTSMSSLHQKKEELMMRLTRKLSVLRAESVAVNEETSVNEALGLTVTDRVERVARPQEVAKFRLHVKEVGHITSLLLSLSGRLARAENALLTLPNDHNDRKTLEEKRDKLLGQLSEAKQLKANIDKRSGYISSMLYNYLTGEEYTDYDHFINMKSKLLVDSREIAEKILLGEEQLSALKETLDQVR